MIEMVDEFHATILLAENQICCCVCIVDLFFVLLIFNIA